MEDWDKHKTTGDFGKVFTMIKPLSVYGKGLHQQFKMFQRHQREELEEYFQAIEKARYCSLQAHKSVLKLERLFKRIRNIDYHLDQITLATPSDINLFELNQCCNTVYEIDEIFEQAPFQQLCNYDNNSLLQIHRILAAGNSSGSFYISNSYCQDLANVRGILRQLERKLLNEQYNHWESIRSLLGRNVSDNFTVSTTEDTIIEQLALSPKVVKFSESDTVINYEIIDTEQITILKDNIQEKEEELAVVLEDVKYRIGQSLAPYLADFQQLLHKLGELDVLFARAKVADDLQCVKPELVEENIIEFSAARHPLLERKLSSRHESFTPRSIALHSGVTLITGINMGGKTVTLRLIHLLALMVHAGMPVPAVNFRIGLRDFVHFSRSDEDTILTGLSHFGQEIINIQNVLQRSAEHGLVLIDEIAHGTSPLAGEALAITVLDQLQRSNCIVVVTTHYTGIAEKVPVSEWQTRGLDYDMWHKKNNSQAEIDIAGLSAFVDYTLVPVDRVKKDSSEALKIAELLGMDKQIIHQAEQLIAEMPKRKPQ